MALETVFAALAAAWFGAAVWVSAGLLSGSLGKVTRKILSGARRTILPAFPLPHSSRANARPALETERRAWWRLVGPLVAGAVGLAFLCGWAVQEPNPADEGVPGGLLLCACLTGLIVVRTLWRTLVALSRTRNIDFPIATVGLWRCRTVVSEAYRRTTSGKALCAALAHEAAHARRHDPLRILLAQMAADLQWPIPGARRRLQAWLTALELGRDDEAIQEGCSPTDLAEAVLAAARFCSNKEKAPVATVAGNAMDLALRVRGLLQGHLQPATSPRATPSWSLRTACLGMISLAAWLGLLYGEPLLRMLPGVAR